jgi:hypothetical protein
LGLDGDCEIPSLDLLVILLLVSRRVPVDFERDGVSPPNLQLSDDGNDCFDLLILFQEKYQGIFTILILVAHNGKIARDVLSLGVGW